MMAEGNTGGCGNASIHWTLRGQRPPHVWKLHVRDPGGSANARHEVVSGTVGEGDEPQVQHERWRRVARSCTTCEVPEQRRKTVGGGCGGKTTDQGEHGADDRVPDSMLGQRVERAEPCAGGSKKGSAVTIHCATTPCFRSFTSGQFLCVETRSCSRSGWNDMEGLRDGPGQAAGGLTQPRASGHVSSATFQESLHTQGGWTTATPGHCCPRGQNRSARRGYGPQSNLRGGLQGVLIRIPTGTPPARCAGCVVDGDHEEESELGAGRRRS